MLARSFSFYSDRSSAKSGPSCDIAMDENLRQSSVKLVRFATPPIDKALARIDKPSSRSLCAQRPDGSLGGGSNYKAWVPRQQRQSRVWARRRQIQSSLSDQEMLGGGFVAPRATRNISSVCN